jgi:hypothetical protein
MISVKVSVKGVTSTVPSSTVEPSGSSREAARSPKGTVRTATSDERGGRK